MLCKLIPLLLTAALFSVSAAPRILVHGHRGARARQPENTIPAFRYAIEHGADAIEFDLGVTRDNVLVVSHDPVLHPPVCTGPAAEGVLRELTLAEVKQWDCSGGAHPEFADQQRVPGTRIPTFDEVLALAPLGNFQFNIEIKSSPKQPQYTPAPDEFARMVAAAIHKHKLEKRVMVQSFDFRTLVAMRKVAPEIRLSALTAFDQRPFAAIVADAGNAEMISPRSVLVTPEKVREAHRAGLLVIPWTVNEEAGWEKLVEAQVDAIITDDPAPLIAYLKKKGLR